MKNRRSLIFVLISIFFFSFFFSVIVLCFLSIGSKSDGDDMMNVRRMNVNEYQYFKFDPTTNETSNGFVSIKYHLDQDEYRSSRKDGKHVLISNAGSQEYKCTGSCFCGNEKNRRTSNSGVFTQGIIYLLAAVSSIVAFSKAKEYFQNECLRQLSLDPDLCLDKSYVTSEVEDCGRTTEIQKEIQTEYLTDEDKEFRKYFCKGHCLFNKELKIKEEIAYAEEFNCPEWIIQDEIKVEVSDIQEEEDMYHLVVKRFEEEFMVIVCEAISSEMFFFKKPKERFREVKCCVGTYKDEINPSIKCKLMSVYRR